MSLLASEPTWLIPCDLQYNLKSSLEWTNKMLVIQPTGNLAIGSLLRSRLASFIQSWIIQSFAYSIWLPGRVE